MKINSIILAIIAIGLISISNTSFAKSRVFTCDQFSAKTLERKARRFKKAIKSASRRYGVSPHLIKAVITVESCFNPRARGTSGEKGLMQLMPATARSIGMKSSYNSWNSIHGGAKYLKFLLKRFNGNKRFAAAAYNGGPGAVSRKHGPKFNQVRRYSNMVMRAYSKMAKKPFRALKTSSRKSKRYKRSKRSKKRSRNYKKSNRSKKKSRKYKTSKRSKSQSRKSKKLKKSKRSRNQSRKNKKLKKSKRSRSQSDKSKKLKTSQDSKSQSRKNKKLKKSRNAKTYRIKKGDNLYKISRKTGVSVKRLKRLNRLKSISIKTGTRLKIR